MPFKEVYIEPEIFMKYNDGEEVFFAYINDDCDYPFENRYSFIDSECESFDVRELPLYKKEYETLFENSKCYHRLLIAASIANGHLDDYLASLGNYNYDFTMKEIEMKLIEDGYSWSGRTNNWTINTHKLEVYLHNVLMISLPVENVNEVVVFTDILLQLNSFL